MNHSSSGGEKSQNSEESNRLLFVLLEHVGEFALATVLAVEVLGHEDTSATVLVRALTTHAGHLPREKMRSENIDRGEQGPVHIPLTEKQPP